MKTVQKILSGGIVVTMNEHFEVFHDGAVAINDNSILAVGAREAILNAYRAEEVIDCSGKVVLPGLINAHTHVPMTLLRGMADDLRLDVWLLGYVMPTERTFVTPEFCELGTLLACAEMIRSGVTAFADMYYFEEHVAAAAARAGVRGVLGQSILQFPTPDAGSYEEGIARCRAFIEAWRGHPLITPAVAPHAPYTNPDESLRLCTDLARELDVPLLIHIAETRLEVENSLNEIGQTVVEHVHEVGLLSAKVLAAHCVHITKPEMKTLFDAGAGVAHCPTSNLKLASGIAPVTAMLRQGVNVGIGTDGPASNNDLDMFEEMRLAAILAKTEANDPTVLPARQALLMATRQGAAALFIDDITGSLEAGKRADILVMDAHPVHNTPQFERDANSIYSRIVYAGKSSDVTDVLCEGRWLMRDRALLTVDVETVLREARDIALRIDAFLRERESSVLSKLLAIGGLRQGESFEVQLKARLSDDGDAAVERLLRHPDVEVLKSNHYTQYDTWFLFDDPSQGRIRFREDVRADAVGQPGTSRTRLTLTTPDKERVFPGSTVLSYSRFIADATNTLRFYREYFRPTEERELQKDRRRWHILYQGVLFYVNLDTLIKPQLGARFIEIKSRTWSARDAELKAERIRQMLQIMGISADDVVRDDYLEMIVE
ncbi:MAG: amidohydrolase [Anaerolineae bacterium]|nr:amidohydrolase [Anaerolineae bacterium]NUQ03846.1 amidohydrolase [Anaerolineae bacterium]